MHFLLQFIVHSSKTNRLNVRDFRKNITFNQNNKRNFKLKRRSSIYEKNTIIFFDDYKRTI
jgi:hypothetical protein